METSQLNHLKKELFVELSMSEAIATDGGKMTDYAGFWISGALGLGGLWIAGYTMGKYL